MCGYHSLFSLFGSPPFLLLPVSRFFSALPLNFFFLFTSARILFFFFSFLSSFFFLSSISFVVFFFPSLFPFFSSFSSYNYRLHATLVKSVVDHIFSGGTELMHTFDDLVHRLKEVLFVHSLSSSSNRKHPCFSTNSTKFCPSRVRTQPGQ